MKHLAYIFGIIFTLILTSCAKQKAQDVVNTFLTAAESKNFDKAIELYPQYAKLKDNIVYKLSSKEPVIEKVSDGYRFTYRTNSRGTLLYELEIGLTVKDGVIISSSNYYHPKAESLFSREFLVKEFGNKDRTDITDVDYQSRLNKLRMKYQNVINGLNKFKIAYMKRTPTMYKMCPSMNYMKDYLSEVSYEAWAIKDIIHGEDSQTGEMIWLIILDGDINNKRLSITLSDNCKTVVSTLGFLVKETFINDFQAYDKLDRTILAFGCDQDIIKAVLK